jgi:hypothetical protein
LRLNELLKTKLDAFQWGPNDVSRTPLIKHKIDTGTAAPVKKKQYKIAQAVQGVLDETISDLHKQGLIEPSISPWCSPVMIVKQLTREGKSKFRFISDNRALNDVTIKDSFPLNRMDAAFDSLGGSAYFTVVDMARGYYQVELEDESKEKTAFTANGKLWQWKVMTLGLCNAPSTYTRLMDLVLHGINYKYCLVYLDDTIIFSKTFDEHLVHVGEVLDRIKKANLKLRPEKCIFASDTVKYLGYVVTSRGITPDHDKVVTISEMKFPKSAKGMIRFLGVVNFYRDFIVRFSNTASVLYKMAQSEAKFKSKMKCEAAHRAFEKLKMCLVAEPILAYPDFSKPFYVQTDASNFAIGGVIGQFRMVNGKNKFFPIMYGSRHLTDAESRYSATERELTAIVWANKRFAPYVFGRHVTYITDHKPLTTMRELSEPMGRLGRLFNNIQDADYTLVYQPGVFNYTADMLSRPEHIKEVNSMEMRIGSAINWKSEQSKDPEIGAIIKLFEMDSEMQIKLESKESKWSRVKNSGDWYKIRDELELVDGVVMVKANGECGRRVVVPQGFVRTLLELKHDMPLSGHRDFEKTYSGIQSKFFWQKMHKDVKNYCKTCHLCQTRKHLGKANRAPLKTIVVNVPWGLIGLDVTGPLKRSINGNLYVIVAVDYFTKFCVAKAIPDFTAETTAKFIFEEIICKLGAPKSIISDQGVNFKAKMFARLCQLCNVKTANSTVYHPIGNALVERMNKTMKQILTMYVDDANTNWDEYLQAAISAYNTSPQASSKFSPYEANFGRCPVVLADVMLAAEVMQQAGGLDDYVTRQKANAQVVQEKIKANLRAAHETQKYHYDKFVSDGNLFQVGEWVLVVNERSIPGKSKSFKERAVGPFKILERFNDVDYVLAPVGGGKSTTVHYNRLRKYSARSEEEMVKRQRDEVATTKKLCKKKTAMEVVVEHSTAFFWKLMGARANDEPQDEAGEAEGEWGQHEGHGQDESSGEENELDLGLDDNEDQAVGGGEGEALVVAQVAVNVVEEEEDEEGVEETVICLVLVEGVACGKVCKNEHGRKIHHGSKHRGLETNQPQLNVEQAAAAGGIFGAVLNMFNN